MNNKKLNLFSRKFIYLLTMSAFLSLILLNYTLSFAEETGSIDLEIKFVNNDRISNWQTVLKIFQDGDINPYRIIEFPESNPYVIDSLPLDHKYTVKIYVNDMYAGEGFLSLKDATAKMDVGIPLQAGMQFIVLYNDNETAIQDATVSIKSHEGNEWAAGSTNSAGKTLRFWLQSNTATEDYYIAEVSLGVGLVYEYGPITYSPGVMGDIKIITPWASNIENRVTVKVYKDASQKVTRSDGAFYVELHDSKTNKVKTSSVNIRGEAHFSNFKVDQYTIVVFKKSDDPNIESEVWASRNMPIIGDEGTIQIFKTGVFFQTSTITCNCVAFRLDDVQDYYLRDAQLDIMGLFQQKKADLTVGIIGSAFGEDLILLDFLNRGVSNKYPTLEIASHSYTNALLTSLDKNEQQILLEKTNQVIYDKLNVNPKVLIPPLNLFNDETLELLPELGITHITGHIEENHSPPYLGEDLDIFYFPANTHTAKLQLDGVTWEKKKRSVLLDEIRDFIGKYGYAEVMMHQYEFSITEFGAYTGETDKQMIGEVGTLIDELRDLGIEIVTISEINEHVIKPIEQTSVKKADSQLDAKSCDCVAFRFSPVQDYWLNDVQIGILDTFAQRDAPVTIGILGNLFGSDIKIVNYLKNRLAEDNLIEVASNGWNYESITELTAEEQNFSINLSIDKISNILNIETNVFIPPYDNFNEDTITALHKNNIEYISSNIRNDPPPYQLTNLELYHFPSGTATGQFNAITGIIEVNPYEETYAEVQKNLKEHGFSVVTVDASAFSVVNNGNYVNQIDEEKINELELLIQKIQGDGLKIVSVGTIDRNSGGIEIPEWIKNNAGWWSGGQIDDNTFVQGIQYLIGNDIIRFHSSDTSTSDSSPTIPSWIKNNAGWWSQGVLTDSDFVSAIQWLIINGIIIIPGESSS
ncbi:MAG: polysaccharide deacetylase family protein [Thaumarchaeota archaeon]|nr:polysaccharide deacetylase family protein [Nitrososphaerota archaeon]